MSDSPLVRGPDLIPRLAIHRHGENVLLHSPSGGEPGRPLGILPRLPATLVNWLMLAADIFFEDESCCIAFILLYSPTTGRFEYLLPRQTCRADGVVWTLSASGLPTIPRGYFFVGTLQSHPDAPHDIAAVPRIPGLHLLYHPGKNDPTLHAVLRYDQPQTADIIDAQAIIAPDHQQFLNRHRERFSLV